MTTNFRSLFSIKTLMCSLALFCLVAALPTRALAWGDEGHRIVARVAEKGLTPKAQTAIAALLSNDAFISQCQQQQHIPVATFADRLACIATWADKVRGQRPATAGWHFVDIPRNAGQYSASRDCAQGNCVIQEVERAFTVLSNPQSKPLDRQEALKFVVHFVGDMHQPLHDATDTQDQEAINNGFPTDRGGNQVFVTWLGQPTNKFGNWELHAVWDSGIIEARMKRTGEDEVALARQLVNSLTATQKAFEKPSPAGGAAAWRSSLDSLLIQWAQEAHALADQNAYADLGPQDMNDVAVDKGKKYHRYHLTQVYETANEPVVDDQLQAAGVRLARVLNEAFR